MADEQLFRTAFNGFNKDDVISYIDGINRTAAENQEWFDKQSRAMAETIKRLNKENAQLKEGSFDVESAAILKDAKARIAELENELSIKTAELEKAKQLLSERPENTDAGESGEEYAILLKEKETLVANLRQACQRIYDEQQKNEELSAKITVLTEKISEQPEGESEAKADPEEIEKLKREIEETENRAAAQIEELTVQNRQLTSRLTLLQAQANANAQTARVSSAGIYTPVPNLDLDAKFNERIRMLEDQAKRLEAENERLRLNSDISGEELQILKDKARLYDDIKNNVARIVDDARKKAAEMIKDAEISSKETMENGIAVLNQMQRRIHLMQEEIESARKVYNDATLSMAGMLSGLDDSVSITDNHLIAILGTQEK